MTDPTSGNSQLATRNLAAGQRRVVHLPVYAENAYQPMLMEAQRQLGWDVIDGGGGGNFLRTALRDWKADVIHFHWLHPYLLREGRISSWIRGYRFLAEVACIRRTGTRIVWTVHNLTNHDRSHCDIEQNLTRRFAQMCHLIVTHGQFAAEAARQQFDIPEVVPMLSVRFPNYSDRYKTDLSPTQARSRWGLKPNQLVVGYLGRVEPYKQVCELVTAFRRLAGDNHRLLIGGRASTPDYAQEVRSAINGDGRIRYLDEYVPDHDMAGFLLATDVMACPSKGILTSSSVPLAMSFGRAVIAPADGCIPEEVGDSGYLYDSSSEDGLATALRRAFGEPDSLCSKGEKAKRLADASSPQQIAKQILNGYETLNDGQRPTATRIVVSRTR